MFVLVSYDVRDGRTEKFRKILCRYLMHEQNSVFCGLLSRPELRELEVCLKSNLTENDKILMLICENRLNVDVVRLGNDDESLCCQSKSVVL
ncbi:MAG: CRISPR-associated endonuclease Cas2 [Gammaproteobacteria bacterium]|nr:CRISPR-associated endonuclease Cas2 [Gammaproteobacteria bacterium]